MRNLLCVLMLFCFTASPTLADQGDLDLMKGLVEDCANDFCAFEYHFLVFPELMQDTDDEYATYGATHTQWETVRIGAVNEFAQLGAWATATITFIQSEQNTLIQLQALAATNQEAADDAAASHLFPLMQVKNTINTNTNTMNSLWDAIETWYWFFYDINNNMG